MLLIPGVEQALSPEQERRWRQLMEKQPRLDVESYNEMIFGIREIARDLRDARTILKDGRPHKLTAEEHESRFVEALGGSAADAYLHPKHPDRYAKFGILRALVVSASARRNHLRVMENKRERDACE